MIEGRVFPAVAAAAAASVLALVLLVPFVAVQYRRRGALGAGPTLVAAGALLYVLALASYTILPLPVVTASFCADGGALPQLVPGRFLADAVREGSGGASGLLANPVVQQVVFNVVLFVPAGMLARHLLRRGVLTATLVGAGVSLLVEVTQLTGVWYAYPCAYRLFDVDDLLANTTGALIGALVAPVLRLLPGQQAQDPTRARPVGSGRRLLGMLCDWAFSLGLGQVLGFVYTVAVLELPLRPAPGLDAAVRASLTALVPAAVLLVVLVRTRRTVGEAIIHLRPTGAVGSRATVVRWLVGIGGYLLLSAPTGALSGTLAGLLALASVVAVTVTRNHRGLAYRVVGWQVEDDRAQGPEIGIGPTDGDGTVRRPSRGQGTRPAP